MRAALGEAEIVGRGVGVGHAVAVAFGERAVEIARELRVKIHLATLNWPVGVERIAVHATKAVDAKNISVGFDDEAAVAAEVPARVYRARRSSCRCDSAAEAPG